MRLIDADALLDKQEALYMKRHILFHGVTAYTIESSPTIDPETLPIVQGLRAELEQYKVWWLLKPDEQKGEVKEDE